MIWPIAPPIATSTSAISVVAVDSEAQQQELAGEAERYRHRAGDDAGDDRGQQPDAQHPPEVALHQLRPTA